MKNKVTFRLLFCRDRDTNRVTVKWCFDGVWSLDWIAAHVWYFSAILTGLMLIDVEMVGKTTKPIRAVHVISCARARKYLWRLETEKKSTVQVVFVFFFFCHFYIFYIIRQMTKKWGERWGKEQRSGWTQIRYAAANGQLNSQVKGAPTGCFKFWK